ncbi:STAS domain-containing protein [Streptomyces sp. NPDC003038]|uniref:STAS domain-containing protein n=1 Tax=unclassified Streptomyces TaxID=2593676 RepID=UPI0033A81118
MLTHAVDQGVLVISLHSPIDIGNRAATALEIGRLLHAHRADYVVLELAGCPASAAAISVVHRAHRLCAAVGASLAVVTPTDESRRLLGAGGGRSAPRLYASTTQAILAKPHPGPGLVPDAARP